MKNRFAFVICSLLLFLGQSISYATVITFGTGIGVSIGEPDLNVEIASSPSSGLPSHPFVVRPYPYSVEWNAPIIGTNWVSPTLSGNGIDVTNAPPGTYTYNLTFELPHSFANPVLSIQYFTDNDMVSVTLNGNLINFTPSPQVTMGHGGTDNSQFFRAGNNVLTIGVANWSTDWNPTGIDLFGSVTYIPEPCTLLLLGLGGLILRKKNTK